MLQSSDTDPQSVARRLVQPPNPNAQVWRYMSFARLMWLLSKKQLWFSRADLLDDTHEAVLEPAIFGAGFAQQPDQAAQTKWIESLKDLKRRLFVSCWHLSEHESHAMWRVYCGRNDGVAIVASYAALQQSIGPLPIGLVRYELQLDPNQALQLQHEPIFSIWRKRPMFSHEREVRIGIYDGWLNSALGSTDSRSTIGMPIDWDPDETLARIHVHPEADASYAEAVNAALKQFAPRLSVLGAAWSSLSATPPY